MEQELDNRLDSQLLNSQLLDSQLAAVTAAIALTINGEAVLITDVSPTTTLLEYLRLSRRTGTKEGCGDGDCGACTVAIIGSGSDGTAQYQAVNSCLIPLGAVAGRQIVTVEGLATQGQTAALHPVQAAMVQTGGSQCGYCTPGFVMSLFAAYYDGQNNDQNNGQVDDLSVEGNLCRCTGYLSIRRAARLLAVAEEGDRFTQQLEQANPQITPLHYSGLDHQFHRPTHLGELLKLLVQHPTAMLVAGATDLGLELSHHRQDFPVLISLEAVVDLKQIQISPAQVEIGAAVPLSQIEAQLRGVFPCMDEMLHWFAARQVRNRATLGGNIGTASPIGDLPPVLLALNAELRLVSPAGERILPLASFFKGYRQTDLQPAEVIAAVRIPRSPTAGAVRRLSQSYKIGKRGTDDISIVAAAFVVDLDAKSRVVHARLGYGGVAAIPIRAIAVETFLLGRLWNPDTVQLAKVMLKDTFTPLSDLRGSADYRQQLVANLFEKFFVEVTDPATQEV